MALGSHGLRVCLFAHAKALNLKLVGTIHPRTWV